MPPLQMKDRIYVRNRYTVPHDTTVPGPSKYLLPPTVGYIDHDFTKRTAPAYSILGKRRGIEFANRSPGPKYGLDDGKLHGKAWTMLGKRTELKLSHHTSGPASYSLKRFPENLPIFRNSPQIIMPDKINRECIVGRPNLVDAAYGLPKLPTGPAFSMGQRHRFGSPFGLTQLDSPGPANYPAGDLYVNKRRPGAVTIKGRFPPIGIYGIGPGPAGYDVIYKPIMRSAPAVSMKFRHSKAVGIALDQDYDLHEDC